MISRHSQDRDRDHRGKSQSDERSISYSGVGVGGAQWKSGKGGKVIIDSSDIPFVTPLSENVTPSDLSALGYQIRPKFGEKFSSEVVQGIIKGVLEDFFSSPSRKEYDHDQAEGWIEQIAKELNARVKGTTPRYKFVTHVTLGERIGGGIHIGMKCQWDADSDHYATYSYLSENIICIATICGIYCY